MHIQFADRRPEGEYAVVLPVAGKDGKSVASVGERQAAVAAALDRQRFEGDAWSTSEQFFDDAGKVRRLIIVGTGNGALSEGAEKLGGNVVAKLLTSGETKAVIDLSGLGYDTDSGAKVALAAALRSWRYDRYRTTLKDKQKPTLNDIVLVGAPADTAQPYPSRWEPAPDG